ncbi:MAG TPA: hydrolase [Synergistaceae bacterium]|nr:MAG: Metal dependent phosphohydrolase [Synergistales bacterium 57_84]KUK88696.1 MAG: Metal dependent phosphohydrolase [Synergistales bacterium 58_81]HBG14090.1 hydrolase [Synergistaceae bacterium]HCP06856.1 hydrolase [Synergistaceae bacterium]
MKQFDRNDAMEILQEHNSEINHIRHALAVEAAMRFFARVNGENEEEWGLAGLVHDIDWETTNNDPSMHTHLGASWLRDAGYPDTIVRAVLAHGWGICSDVEPVSLMEKHLYAIDELTGFVTAVALVRPGKSLQDLTVKSVKKKWKDKAFARGVDRDVIEKGTAMLGKPLEELIEGVIEALRPVEKEIGLGEEA